ncbi:MAG: hypothetical protein WCL50_03145 [Spirochaetota bacterium]
MKKILVVLLSLVVVTGMFAQATVNGYVRSTTTIDKDGNMAYAGRLRLNLNFTSEDKNFSMFTRLQDSTSFGAAPGISYANGTAKLFDGMVIVNAGKLSNYDYNFGCGVSEYKLGAISNDGYAMDGTLGTVVEVLPMAGLNVGLAIIPKTPNTLSAEDFGVSVKYALEGLGTVVVESTLANDVSKSRISASFKYTGVENLDVAVGYKGLSSVGVYAIANYKMDALSVQVVPQVTIPTTGDTQIYVEGDVTYNMAPMAFNVLFAYDTTKATLAASYFAGLEAIYTVGKLKALTGFWYNDVAGVTIPIEVRVSF